MKKDYNQYILDWNNRFPVDRWWRNKYNIPFMSKAHQEISFLDQLFEYREDKVFKDIVESFKYKPNKGDWLKKQKRTVEERTQNIIEEARKELDNLPDTLF